MALFLRIKKQEGVFDSQSLAQLGPPRDLRGPLEATGIAAHGDHVGAILADLSRATKSQPAAGRAVSVNSLLQRIRIMRDDSPHDPFVEVLMALHDALEYRNRWMKCTTGQFAAAYRILAALAAEHAITDDHVEKAIQDLEEAGLDTLPFETPDRWGLDE